MSIHINPLMKHGLSIPQLDEPSSHCMIAERFFQKNVEMRKDFIIQGSTKASRSHSPKFLLAQPSAHDTFNIILIKTRCNLPQAALMLWWELLVYTIILSQGSNVMCKPQPCPYLMDLCHHHACLHCLLSFDAKIGKFSKKLVLLKLSGQHVSLWFAEVAWIRITWLNSSQCSTFSHLRMSSSCSHTSIQFFI